MAFSFLPLISSISASSVFEFRRTRHRADARARTGLVQNVNRLVRQKSVRDVTVGKFHGRLDRRIGELGVMMLLVFVAKPFQNLNRVLDRRRFDFHGLKTAFERGVFLDVFAILVQRRRADALHLAARKRGLDDVARVHRAFRRTRADNRVQFVNEQNDVFRAADFVHDGFDALLKLSAIFCAGNHQREIERDDALVQQNFRHVALRDFLRETFDNRSFANASFAEQNRIIFRAAAKDLNHALDFIFAADDRIHVALARDFREVAAKRLERGRFDFAFFLRRRFFPGGNRGFLGGKIRVKLLQSPVAAFLDVHVEIFQDFRGDAVAFAQQPEQNVFRADVSVVERLRLLRREREDFFHARRVGDVADHFLVRAGAGLLLDFHADGFEVNAHALQER